MKELKQTIFNVLKCNVDYGDDKKLQELKIKLKQHEKMYKISLSNYETSNDNKYIRECNRYNFKIAKLKGIIKLNLN